MFMKVEMQLLIWMNNVEEKIMPNKWIKWKHVVVFVEDLKCQWGYRVSSSSVLLGQHVATLAVKSIRDDDADDGGRIKKGFWGFFPLNLRDDLGHYESFWWWDSFNRKLTAAEEEGDLGR